MKIYVVYNSEDEGHRYPVGEVYTSITDARIFVINNIEFGGDATEFKPTKKQVENSSPPNCHGKVVAMYCADGHKYMVDDKDHGYTYDWVYIIELSVN